MLRRLLITIEMPYVCVDIRREELRVIESEGKE